VTFWNIGALRLTTVDRRQTWHTVRIANCA
jgi:hypothetical protein